MNLDQMLRDTAVDRMMVVARQYAWDEAGRTDDEEATHLTLSLPTQGLTADRITNEIRRLVSIANALGWIEEASNRQLTQTLLTLAAAAPGPIEQETTETQ